MAQSPDLDIAASRQTLPRACSDDSTIHRGSEGVQAERKPPTRTNMVTHWRETSECPRHWSPKGDRKNRLVSGLGTLAMRPP